MRIYADNSGATNPWVGSRIYETLNNTSNDDSRCSWWTASSARIMETRLIKGKVIK